MLNYNKRNFFLKLKLAIGIPKLLWYGTEKEYNIMIMEHLGYNLEDLFNKCNRKFTLKTVLMLGIQMVRLKFE